MTKKQYQFQTEVSRLLDIVAKSLYSEKEIFLRELISNASDACDRRRYESLSDASLLPKDETFKITLTPNAEKNILVISDNGIGMNHDELIQHLGTIAKSGTSAFLENIAKAQSKDDQFQMIGQFGVGFYSAFIVSDKVEVFTKRAGETQAWKWISQGENEFTIEETEKASVGTEIHLHLNDEHKEFLEKSRIEHVVKSYSDHIAVPICLIDAEQKEEQLNSASALWTRPKSEIKEEEYKEFYHHVAHAFDEPLLTLHNKVEGTIEYTSLLFIPGSKPFDLFSHERKNQLKLYVKRVFITSDCKELVPTYLRFVKGVVDSSDLPLNLSRELLQNNAVLSKIQKSLTSKVLQELQKLSEKETDKYQTFWETFGAVLKEGLYEDFAHRDQLLKLARFYTSKSKDKLVSLDEYIKNMQADQKHIYTVSGQDKEQLLNSPQIEGFLDRDIEVILFTDPVDEFWTGMVNEYEGKSFQSITKGSAEFEKEASKKEDKAQDENQDELNTLIAALKIALADSIKDVRISHRLTNSPVCLIADENDVDIHLQKLLQQTQQSHVDAQRILEINPSHALIKSLTDIDHKDTLFKDTALILLDQARLLEGEKLPDPAGFSKRMNLLLEKGLNAA